MIVAKFGGTSVADAEAIGRLIDIVRRRIVDQPVVVVSALARVTDRLLSLAAEAEIEEPGTLDQALSALLDAIAGRGELWSSRLVAGALSGAGINVTWIDIRPIMVTDARFTRATPY